MQRVAITTLGCKTNQFESAAMGESLARDGFIVVPFDGEADIYVINTCTVTARTDAESRQLIRRAARRSPGARVVVTGCYAQLAHEKLKDLPGVDLILGNAEKKGLAGLLKAMGPEQQILVSDISREREVSALQLESFAEHTRAFLQVQNGCDAFCSYCIVPYARGRSRSVPFDEALAGVSSFGARGFREVVLTGIHLGAYGLDLDPPRSLLEILVAVEEQGLVERLRVGSVEPNEITEKMIKLMARSRVVCPHLHIPLQSGHDRVLQRMRRKYDGAYFRDLVQRLTEAVPDIAIGCDIIAGFPGESEAEHEATLDFVNSLPVAYLHVFPFSPRPGTAAAAMPGQLPGNVIRNRAESLRRLSEVKKGEFYRRFIGMELDVLGQEEKGEGMLKGLSRNYIPVLFPGERDQINREVRVRILAAAKGGLQGKVCGV